MANHLLYGVKDNKWNEQQKYLHLHAQCTCISAHVKKK